MLPLFLECLGIIILKYLIYIFLSNLSPAEWLPQEGWQEEQGLFHYQWSSDQITHNKHSQAHIWNVFQEAHPSGTQRDPKIYHKGHGNSRLLIDTRLNKVGWAKGIKMCHTLSRCCPQKVMKWMKLHQMNSTCLLPKCLLPLSKTYKWLMWWEQAAGCQIKL